MAIDTIFYRGAPIRALVETADGMKDIQFTPVVCDERIYPEAGIINRCIGLILENGRSVCWGLINPDLVASWRGIEVIRLLGKVERRTLHDVWYAGKRTVREDDFAEYVEPIIRKIGKAAHERIMSLPVPDEIIRATLDNAAEERRDGSGAEDWLASITDEVRAGTIEWREEFGSAGVIRP